MTPPAEGSAPELLGTLRQLRHQGQPQAAHALLARHLAQHADPRLAFLAWQHEAFWWQPVQGPRVALHRRGPQDAALVRALWSDASFMQRFNRMAAALPDSDEALQALLLREHWALPEDTRTLHWTISAAGRGCGFVSLVDISFAHRRAEFLIGVQPTTGAWVAAEAAHLVLGFAAQRMQLQRLSAYFYPENRPALAMACKLGFEQEGLLRGYLLGANGQRADLVVAGLLLDDAFFARTARIRRRLLGPG